MSADGAAGMVTEGPLRVGLIGLGAIGRVVARELAARRDVVLVGALVRDPSRTMSRAAPPPELPLFASARALGAARPQLIVECAGHEALDAYAGPVLASGIDLLLVSSGALADRHREARMRAAANAPGAGRLTIAAGAIGAIDWLAAANAAGLDQVTYRSRKPPAAWRGSLAETHANLDQITSATTFFSGSARQAAIDWPKNANVAATVALATLGLDATHAELIADPTVEANIHEVEAVGRTGRMQLRIEGRVDPDNPKTSTQTAWSIAREVANRAGRWSV